MCSILKKYWSELKWVANYIKSFLPQIIFLIVNGVLISLVGVSFAFVSRNLIDIATHAAKGSFVNAGILFGCLIIVQMLLNSVYSVTSTRISENMGNKMKQNMFEKLMKTEWLPYNSIHSGDVITRMTSDTSNVTSAVVDLLPSIISLIVQLAVAFIALMYFEPALALTALVIAPVFILLGRVFAGRIRTFHLKTQEAESKTRSFIQEILQNILTVKAFNIERVSTVRLADYQKEHKDWVIKRSWFSAFSGFGLSFGYWLGYFLALTWGAYRLSTGFITFGTMTAFLQLVGQIQGPFHGLANIFPRIISSLASTGRLLELENMPAEENHEEDIYEDITGICLENVSCNYIDDTPVLKDITLTIKPEEMIALLGETGEGKTTLIRLLLALIKPSAGKLYIVGKDGSKTEISAATRKFFTYVPQGNTIFSGTIEENIRIGRADASEEEIVECIRKAAAWDFVNELPEGIKTVIGERGVGLSEGQIQRLCIARALLRKAPVLLLDESTSALDIDTEAKILKAIKDDEYKRTCLFITHRNAIADFCDKSYKIIDGNLTNVKN